MKSSDTTLNVVGKTKAIRDKFLSKVAKNGWALEKADDTLKADREFILAAVAMNVSALKYAE